MYLISAFFDFVFNATADSPNVRQKPTCEVRQGLAHHDASPFWSRQFNTESTDVSRHAAFYSVLSMMKESDNVLGLRFHRCTDQNLIIDSAR